MVSATSVERLETMSCAPSGTTPTTLTSPGGGDRPTPVRVFPPDWNFPWRAIKERSSPRTILGPARKVLPEVDWPRSGILLPELPGAERSGERHTDEASATSVPWHPAPVELDESEITRGDIALSLRHLCLAKLSQDVLNHLRVKHPFPGASAPASTGCLLPNWDAQECELPSARGICPGTTQGSGTPACTGGVNADLLGGWCKRPPLCYRCAPTHGDLLGLGGSVSVLETRPTSPANWCAMWDGDHSTDRGQDGHPWRLTLALRDVLKLPEPGPKTRTGVVSTCLWHVDTAAWPWSCKASFPFGSPPWAWATTVGVICTANQEVSRWTQLPSDPAVSETAWRWVTGLLSLSKLQWGSTRSEQVT